MIYLRKRPYVTIIIWVDVSLSSPSLIKSEIQSINGYQTIRDNSVRPKSDVSFCQIVDVD